MGAPGSGFLAETRLVVESTPEQERVTARAETPLVPVGTRREREVLRVLSEACGEL